MIKAACHVHSNWSYDGKWPLDQLAAAFQQRGYSVVMMTEHDKGFNAARLQEHRSACAQVSSDELLMVPGMEYSDANNVVHVLVWGNVPFLGEGLPTLELLKTVAGANGIAVMAHPSRKQAWRLFDHSWRQYLSGIEVWNRKTDGWAPSKTAPALLGDDAVVEYVGLDFHERRQFFPLAMEFEVAGRVSEDTVLEVLRAGAARASAFGRPLNSVSRNATVACGLSAAEGLRRSVAWPVRMMRRALSSPTPHSHPKKGI
jgi:hypothetical protein